MLKSMLWPWRSKGSRVQSRRPEVPDLPGAHKQKARKPHRAERAERAEKEQRVAFQAFRGSRRLAASFGHGLEGALPCPANTYVPCTCITVSRTWKLVGLRQAKLQDYKNHCSHGAYLQRGRHQLRPWTEHSEGLGMKRHSLKSLKSLRSRRSRRPHRICTLQQAPVSVLLRATQHKDMRELPKAMA